MQLFLGLFAFVFAAWQPVPDTPFLQEIGVSVPSERPLNAVAVFQSNIYVGDAAGLSILRDGHAIEAIAGFPNTEIHRLRVLGEQMLIFAANALYVFDGTRAEEIAKGTYVDAVRHGKDIIVASADTLYQLKDQTLHALAGPTPGAMQAIASYAECIYCLGYDRVFLFNGKEFITAQREVIEFGAFPSKDLRAMLAHGSRLIVGTHQGLGVLRGTAATAILGADGLPYDECTALAAGFDHDFWVGTTRGAVRVLDNEFHYFNGPRWLPGSRVSAIAAGENTVAVATDQGLGIIRYEPYTLLKKAAYYEAHLDAWGQKRMAFTHKLEWNGEKQAWMREVSDNDVGWSTHYWASQAFKFAATGDLRARQNAIEGFNALKWSEEITGIPGFPARGVWAVGETGHKTQGGSGGYPAEWHPTEDGLWEWKGDTSSDEIDAQYYYAAIFHDLVADESQKRLAAEHVARIADHIISHGYTLCDVDGKPTVWGNWSPAYFNSFRGAYARGLNGLELLGYIRTAHALSGEARFDDAVEKLRALNYPEPTIRQKLTLANFVNHSDDRLAFYIYYILLTCEKDPQLRAVYRRSLERSWEIERIEQNPWFNFIYGVLTGNDCEEQQAARHLREWPLDLRTHSFDHSYRRDLETPRGYLPYAGVQRVFSPRESGPRRWTESGAALKGGDGGRQVVDPAGWLDAYWMARYYGIILPPDTDNPDLLTVDPAKVFPPNVGAAPYDGPPMPDVLSRRR